MFIQEMQRGGRAGVPLTVQQPPRQAEIRKKIQKSANGALLGGE